MRVYEGVIQELEHKDVAFRRNVMRKLVQNIQLNPHDRSVEFTIGQPSHKVMGWRPQRDLNLCSSPAGPPAPSPHPHRIRKPPRRRQPRPPLHNLHTQPKPLTRRNRVANSREHIDRPIPAHLQRRARLRRYPLDQHRVIRFRRTPRCCSRRRLLHQHHKPLRLRSSNRMRDRKANLVVCARGHDSNLNGSRRRLTHRRIIQQRQPQDTPVNVTQHKLIDRSAVRILRPVVLPDILHPRFTLLRRQRLPSAAHLPHNRSNRRLLQSHSLRHLCPSSRKIPPTPRKVIVVAVLRRARLSRQRLAVSNLHRGIIPAAIAHQVPHTPRPTERATPSHNRPTTIPQAFPHASTSPRIAVAFRSPNQRHSRPTALATALGRVKVELMF